MSKYHRIINGETADVYDVLEAFGVTCPAIQHAVKKLLMPGQRGAKSKTHDLKEASASILRAIEMQDKREDELKFRETKRVACDCGHEFLSAAIAPTCPACRETVEPVPPHTAREISES